MTKFSIQCLVFLLAFTTLNPSTLRGEDDGPVSSWQSIPNNAFAFVYVDLNALGDSPTLQIPREMVAGIESELNTVFENQIGIRPTELFDATFVVPTFQSAITGMESSTAPGFLLVSFTSPVNVQKISQSLGNEWERRNVNGQDAFVHGDADRVIFHHSENTLALGKGESVQWFIDNRGNEEFTNLSDAMVEAEYGQIIACVDSSLIPKEMSQFLPSELSGFANTNFAAISLDLVSVITFNAVLDFESVDDAKGVSRVANAKLEEGRRMLGGMETSALQALVQTQNDIESSIEPLSLLAAVRYGQKLLGDAEVQRFRNRVLTHIGVEGVDGTMLIGIVPAALAAIGSEANAQFTAISDELEN
ncbi:MAG: hypothetical protein AAFV88_03670 [Planctomycetota bacterium]